MNIEFQVCGLIVSLLLFVVYLSHKRLNLYSEQAFLRTMISVTVMLVLDISSVFAICMRDAVPMLLVNSVCKIYVASLVWCSGAILSYLLVDVFSELKHKRFRTAYYIFTIIEILIVLALPIRIFEQNEAVYTYGPCTAAVYAFCGLNMAATAVCLVMFKNRINARRHFGVSLWLSTWVIAAGVQFFNSLLLLVGFAGSLGLIILYVLLENPESKVDRRFGCFNSHALKSYLDSLISRKTPFCVMVVSFAPVQLVGNVTQDSVGKKFLEKIDELGYVRIFKNVGFEFVCVVKNRTQLEHMMHVYQGTLANSEPCFAEARVAICEKMDSFKSSADVLQCVNFAWNRTNDECKLLEVGEAQVSAFFRRQVVEQELKSAMADDRVEIFLQPIYRVAEKCFKSAEVLVRIRKEDGSLLMPGEFIPVAEENGDILELGYKIFEQACRFLQANGSLGLEYLEINLSVVQCEDENLAGRLIDLMDYYKVNPQQINLEITETASVKAKHMLQKNMTKLMEYGVSFSLDDFGKGESNLMYVVDLPVSIIKFDMDMTKAFFKNEKAQKVVKAVVAMAHEMNLKLVAEGIETANELEGMMSQNIDYIQGYFFSKPLPQKEFVDFINKNA